uniref:Protein kinase domain-containing protein n=1 Tax=Opuntia streptacantha TaxID=393608 RepID=A0A7C9D5U0_OPUST
MGCVIGKRDSGNGDSAGKSALTPPPAPDHPRRRRPSSESVEKQKGANKLHRNSSNFSADEFRRHLFDPCGPTTQKGWPTWLAEALGDVINDFSPRRASTFEKLDKIGQGTYSNVYKARDLVTGKIVALKKVRFDNLEPESVKFMAREILILHRLDHPNVIKLQGLVTSRMSSSIYLVFDYMEHDLSGLSASLGRGTKFTEPQIKCFMKQLFSGLEHCHNNGVLHRDVKGSNLLIDNEGILKIADFGLATFYDPNQKQPMTSRVVTLWYRPPELLLGATSYGVGVDLWSAGCIVAELLAGRPIMPGRTEVEQLHKIFKLCGSPSEDYWRKYKLPNATLFKPQQPYKRCVLETFKDFPSSSLPLIDALLSIDPEGRGTATDALNSEFFSSEPCACDPSCLPKYPPSKEMDVKLRDDAARRQRGLNGKANASDTARRVRMRDRTGRAIPAPEANAELQTNLDRMRLVTQANAKSKSEKFPPPHQDGAVGVHLDTSNNMPLSFGPTEQSFDASHFNPKSSKSVQSTTPAEGPSKRKTTNKEPQLASTWKFIHAWKPSSVGLSMDFMFKGKGTITRVSSSRK